MAYYINRHGQLASTYGMVGDDEVSATDQMKAQEARDQAVAEADTRREIAKTAAGAQRYSSDAGLRLYEQKRNDTPPQMATFKKGGPVIKGEFKHANPTYTKFGQSGDSSLLAKGRK